MPLATSVAICVSIFSVLVMSALKRVSRLSSVSRSIHETAASFAMLFAASSTSISAMKALALARSILATLEPPSKMSWLTERFALAPRSVVEAKPAPSLIVCPALALVEIWSSLSASATKISLNDLL